MFDEAQILTEQAISDMVPATNTSPNALVLYIGTPPRPADPGEAFTERRRQALAGEDDMLYVEFSADRDADSDDRAQWRKANPSFPRRTSETSMLRMQRQLGKDSFRREALASGMKPPPIGPSTPNNGRKPPPAHPTSKD